VADGAWRQGQRGRHRPGEAISWCYQLCPISTLTFLIIPKDGKDVQKRTALKQFLSYVVTDGQQAASGLNYAPLPDAVKQLDVKALSQLTVNGSPIQ
jgi:phosphate transport system substrate-binding protein